MPGRYQNPRPGPSRPPRHYIDRRGRTETSYTTATSYDYRTCSTCPSDDSYLAPFPGGRHRGSKKSVGAIANYDLDGDNGERWAVKMYPNVEAYAARHRGGLGPLSTASHRTRSSNHHAIDHAVGDNSPWWHEDWVEPEIPHEEIRYPWDYPVEEEFCEDWTWKHQANMIKWSPAPLEGPLLVLKSGEHSHLAQDMFMDVMKFMGDYPLAHGEKRSDCTLRILNALHEHEELVDEIYCQLCKQTTSNKSPKPDSNKLGWRLMSIITCFFTCSDTLKPYLTKYISSAAYDKNRACYGIAMQCSQNLRKAYKYGGRKTQPSRLELDACTVGRTSKRQLFALPGGTPVVLPVRPSTVVDDCVDEICEHMGIRDPLEKEEYSIFYVVEKDNKYSPLRRDEYVFDTINELEAMGKDYFLLLQRNAWYYPIHLENPAYVDVMFDQIMRDYLDGMYVIVRPGGLPDKQVEDIAMLAALVCRVKDNRSAAVMSIRDLAPLVPNTMRELPDWQPQRMLNMAQEKLAPASRMTPQSCKAAFLEILSKWFLFGATFFRVKNVSEECVMSPCLLAINRHGVMFLNINTRELFVQYDFSEIISTRRFRTDQNIHYLDIKRGDLMNQKITRVETEQGSDIALLIGQYINVMGTGKQHAHTNGH